MLHVVQTCSRDRIVDQLRALGVETGGVLLVHTAFSKLRPVEGGPDGLIAALKAVLGSAGTLVMPSSAQTLSRRQSRGVPVVEAEQATQTFATADATIAVRRLRGRYE
jgi:aminoglycoside N3'-acetyltransferase